MLIDEVKTQLEAGRGGNGAVAFNRTRLNLGPVGGDGGNGGHIFMEGVSDIGALGFYSGKPHIKAEDGKNGRAQFIDGKRGEDLVLKVPVGTLITNTDSGFTREITQVGERIMMAGGGTGGRGNFKFRGPQNTTPKESEPGKQGDIVNLKLSLKLIADIGLVGLPNAGKSSLLNELTKAKSKVGNYAFTTLEPHLGAYYEIILADIPGLIEGASEGKGLGAKFLKHIERTKTLFHLVSAESDDPVRDYKVVRNELATYNDRLVQENEYVFLTKADMVEPAEIKKILKKFEKIGKQVIPISILDDKSMDEVKKILNKLKDEKMDA